MNTLRRRPGTASRARAPGRGFTLLEVIISLVILGIGVVALLRLFPIGVQRSVESERLTQATLLAQEILEAMKAQGASGLVRVIPGSPELVAMPGDGVDGDEDGSLRVGALRVVNPAVDFNGNGKLDGDYDSYPELDYAGSACRGYDYCALPSPPNQVDDDLDGIIDDDGDSNACGFARSAAGTALPMLPDGDMTYDPELIPRGAGFIGVDDEYPDGIDNDGNGIDINGDGVASADDGDLMIDEDVRLASNFHADPTGRRPGFLWWPLEPGDQFDNDGDGERIDPLDPYSTYADGLDNDGDGLIDEGIDEEVFNNRDDDGDGSIDEDCRASSYPFTPRKFFRRLMLDDDGDGIIDEDPPDGVDNDYDGRVDEDPPNDNADRFAWQILVARVPDGGGDGINNDGDVDSRGDPRALEVTDEEIRDGLNDDPPCPLGDLLVDEDCQAAPVRNFRRVTIRITWNGDGDQNNDGFPGDFGVDDDRDGVADFEDPEVSNAMAFEAAILGIDLGDPDSARMLYERWAEDDDEDGRIDEEKLNGLDDDLDGRVDEDCYGSEYNLTGFVEL